MYREKDYNRKRKDPDEEYFGDSHRRPRVVRGDSVFDDHRAKKKRRSASSYEEDYQNYYEEEPFNAYEEEDDFEDASSFSGRKEKRRRKKRPLLVLLLLFCGLFLGFWFYLTANLNSHPLPKDDESLGITTDGKFGVTNIAFFGVDARDGSDTGRSDAIMIVTVDLIHGDLKMTSLLRDSKVSIEGHGENKLNHAYAYGGPELAVKTINQNFDLDVREFVTVNFDQLAEIVDAVGGVTIDVTEAERNEINYNMQEIDPDHPEVTSTGLIVLDGTQAVAYSRIRSIDSDNARTDRQQEVLNAIFASVQNMGILEFPKFVHDFSEIVDTSMSSLNVLKVAPILLRNPEIEQYTIPDAEFETDLWGGIDSSGMWCWHYDLDAAAARLHSIVYGE
ncbi:MAG: LCP family protein [Firmicutes bacterium]|nr:LCP family protein [Bacillota bacterium]